LDLKLQREGSDRNNPSVQRGSDGTHDHDNEP
jgi:hypothetical protein